MKLVFIYLFSKYLPNIKDMVIILLNSLICFLIGGYALVQLRDKETQKYINNVHERFWV